VPGRVGARADLGTSTLGAAAALAANDGPALRRRGQDGPGHGDGAPGGGAGRFREAGDHLVLEAADPDAVHAFPDPVQRPAQGVPGGAGPNRPCWPSNCGQSLTHSPAVLFKRTPDPR
jgi:hypothetical protein